MLSFAGAGAGAGAQATVLLGEKNQSSQKDQRNGFEEFSNIMSHVLVRENQQVPKQVKDFSDLLNDLFLLTAMLDSTKTKAKNVEGPSASVPPKESSRASEGKNPWHKKADEKKIKENTKENKASQNAFLDTEVPKEKIEERKEELLEKVQEKDTAASCEEAFKAFQAGLEKAKKAFNDLISGQGKIIGCAGNIPLPEEEITKILNAFQEKIQKELEKELDQFPKEGEQVTIARQDFQKFTEEMGQKIESIFHKIIEHNEKVKIKKEEEDKEYNARPGIEV